VLPRREHFFSFSLPFKISIDDDDAGLIIRAQLPATLIYSFLASFSILLQKKKKGGETLKK
jgi:hypothetical protein